MSAIAAIGRIQDIQEMFAKIADPLGAAQKVATPQAAVPTDIKSGKNFTEVLNKALDSVAAPSVPATDESTGVATGKVTNPNDKTGDDVAAAAQKYIGVPYVWGGNDENGMDCSGFVKKVFGDLGVEMPRLAREQMFKGELVDGFENAKPGDLISSFNGEHISIYLGNGKAIDAPVPGQTIEVRDAWEMTQNLEKIVRVIPSAAGESTTSVKSSISISDEQAGFLAGLRS